MNFHDRFDKNNRLSNFTKIHPLGAELSHAEGHTDRQTDRHHLASSHFCAILRTRPKMANHLANPLYYNGIKPSA